MKINWQKHQVESPFDLSVREFYQVHSDAGVRCYFGAPHAVSELTRGLAALYPHKKSAAYIKGGTPYLAQALPALSREGVMVQNISWPLSETNLETWFATLKKDTLFVMFPEDHLFTGQMYPVDSLKKFLHEKKIFTISLSHQSYRLPAQKSALTKVHDYEIRICLMDAQHAFALLGHRIHKMESLISGVLPWPYDTFEKIKNLLTPLSENKEQITKFEAQKIASMIPFFSSPSLSEASRLYDRAVMIFPDMDSSAVQEMWLKKKSEALPAPSLEVRVESMSLCRWGGLKTMDWAVDENLSAPKYCNLIVFSSEILSPTLYNHFCQEWQTAYEAVLSLQN